MWNSRPPLFDVCCGRRTDSVFPDVFDGGVRSYGRHMGSARWDRRTSSVVPGLQTQSGRVLLSPADPTLTALASLDRNQTAAPGCDPPVISVCSFVHLFIFFRFAFSFFINAFIQSDLQGDQMNVIKA